MPTYEYRCGRCGVFEAVRPSAQRKEPVPCPSCGKRCTDLVISRCSFTLSGSGWARNGYASSSSDTK